MIELDKVFRFRKFGMYRDARTFSRAVKSLALQSFPQSEKYCLLAQLWRALDSVVLNIAEGSARGTDRDFARFLSISRGSLNEVVATLDTALDQNYLTPAEHSASLHRAASLANQISAFRKRLQESDVKSQKSNLKSAGSPK